MSRHRLARRSRHRYQPVEQVAARIRAVVKRVLAQIGDALGRLAEWLVDALRTVVAPVLVRAAVARVLPPGAEAPTDELVERLVRELVGGAA